MKRAVFYLALALSVSPALAGSEADTPRDVVLLTVGGLVGKTNRGPVDAKRDVLLAEQKAAFKSAFEFDRAMLLALPQATVTGQPNNFVKHARFSGPVLRALLGYLEAAKLKVSRSRRSRLRRLACAGGYRRLRLYSRALGRRRSARDRTARADLARQERRAEGRWQRSQA